MPEGYGFPVAQRLWVPLRLNVLEYERGQGPALQLFGRLAPDVTLDQAQTELATLGRRAATDHPQTHEHLRPKIMPYPCSVFDLSSMEAAMLRLANLFLALLLVLVCGNVALFAKPPAAAVREYVRGAAREASAACSGARVENAQVTFLRVTQDAAVAGGQPAAGGPCARHQDPIGRVAVRRAW